jgi:hypothetical protein
MIGGTEDWRMATVQIKESELLEAVVRLAPEEFDAFIDQALSRRKSSRISTLPAKEGRLIQRINLAIPESVCDRFDVLVRKRKRKALTESEHAELLRLTDRIESQDAERAAALLELAKLRRIPVRVLMKQMGIQAAPIDG